MPSLSNAATRGIIIIPVSDRRRGVGCHVTRQGCPRQRKRTWRTDGINKSTAFYPFPQQGCSQSCGCGRVHTLRDRRGVSALSRLRGVDQRWIRHARRDISVVRCAPGELVPRPLHRCSRSGIGREQLPPGPPTHRPGLSLSLWFVAFILFFFCSLVSCSCRQLMSVCWTAAWTTCRPYQSRSRG